MTVLFLVVASALAAEPAPPAATLDLDAAIARFREASPLVQGIDARADEAHATVRLAGAAAQPIVVVQGSYTRNNQEVRVSVADMIGSLTDALPVPVEIDPSSLPDDLLIQPLDQWNAAATVQIPVLAPSAWATVGAARAGARAADAGNDAARLAAEGALVKAAYGADAAVRVVEATAHAEAAAKAHLDSARSRVGAGVGTSLEVLVAETELARRASDHVAAVARLDAARRAIGALLDLEGPVAIAVPAPERLGTDADAAAAHPRQVAAEAAMTATEQAVASAWWRHAPTLSATGSLFASDVVYPTGLKTGWRLGATATWAVWDGGARYGLLDQARAQRARAESEARSTALDLSRERADADAAVEAARELLALADQALRTATAAEATAARLYDADLATSLDSLDAQQRRLEAELAHAGAVAGLASAFVDRRVAAGVAWATP